MQEPVARACLIWEFFFAASALSLVGLRASQVSRHFHRLMDRVVLGAWVFAFICPPGVFGQNPPSDVKAAPPLEVAGNPPGGEAARPTRNPLLDYKFTNELGQAVSLADFDGQALAITFFFTRCPMPEFCPRLSRNFQEASQELSIGGQTFTNWHFLSITFDPEFDTPAVLRDYAELYGYDPRHWSFITGPKDKINELAAQSGIKTDPENGVMNHNFRTLIIDAAGHLQMVFPTGGNLSEAIVSEMRKAAGLTSLAADGPIQPAAP